MEIDIKMEMKKEVKLDGVKDVLYKLLALNLNRKGACSPATFCTCQASL